MMKFFKSIFTREQPKADYAARVSKIRADDWVDFNSATDDLPKSRVNIYRSRNERREQAEDWPGMKSAGERQIIGKNDPELLHQHKAAWIEKYRERAAQRQAAQADQPKQTPRGPRIKF